MSELILRRLSEVFPIVTYSGEVELLDENKDPHRFSILRAYDVDIYVDEKGHFWMSEAEIRRSLGISKAALHNAITRFIDSQTGCLLSKTRTLYLKDAANRLFPFNCHNLHTIIAVLLRMQDDLVPEKALQLIPFLFHLLKYEPTDLENIILTKQEIRGYVYVVFNGEYYKIGATRQLEYRLQTLHNQLSMLELIHTIATDEYFALERKLHQYFRDRHVHQEWFALTPEDIEWVKATYP